MPLHRVDFLDPEFLSTLPHELYIYDEGSLALAPGNELPNSAFTELDGDGSPESYALPRFTEVAGFHTYVSEEGGPKSTLARQNASEAGLEDFASFNSPYISGISPIRSEEFASDVLPTPAEPPEIEVHGALAEGFDADDYGYLYGFSDARRQPTTPTEAVEFTLSQNQRPRLIKPKPSPGAVYWDIYLYRVSEGLSSARLHEQVPFSRVRGDSYVLNAELGGGLGGGRRPPAANRTGVGIPLPMRYGIEIKEETGAFDRQPGRYRFAYVVKTRQGVSLPSRPTPEVLRTGIRRNSAFRVRPRGYSDEWVGWIPYVLIAGEWYRVISVAALSSQFVFRDRRGVSQADGDSRHVPIFGYRERERMGDRGQQESPDGLRHILVKEDPPTEDGTKIEPPEGEPDVPTAVGRALPEAGQRLVGYEYTATINGEEHRSRLSPLAKAYLDGSQFLRARLPERVNMIANAEMAEPGESGPVNWLADNGSKGGRANLNFPEPGVLRVTTDGKSHSISGGDDLPNVRHTRRYTVEPDTVYVVKGKIDVGLYQAGAATTEIIFFDASGTRLANASVTSVEGFGVDEYEVEVGGADFPFPEGTSQVEFNFRPSGDPANVGFTHSDFGFFPRIAPRKALQSPGEFADTDPPPSVPFPHGEVGRVESPPQVAGYTGGFDSTTDRIDFSEFSVGDSPRPDTTYGYTVDPDNAATDSEIITTEEGSAWRIRAGSNYSYTSIFMSKTYGNGEESRARLMRFKVESLPQRRSVELIRLNYQGLRYMATLELFPTGNFTMSVSDSFDKNEHKFLGYRVSSGDEIEAELRVIDSGSREGRAEVYIGVNGGSREFSGSISGIDWRGRRPEVAVWGAPEEADPANSYELYVRGTEGSLHGAPVSREVSVSLPEPDIPPRLENGEPTGEYRDTPLEARYEPGTSLRQMYIFKPLDSPTREFPFSRPLTVIPGLTYTVAVQMRAKPLADGRAWVELRSPNGGGEPVEHEIASFTAGEFAPWTGEDVYTIFTVPAGYTQMTLWAEAGAGEYVIQEPARLRGSLTTQVGRDTARALGPANSADFEITVSSEAPDTIHTPSGFGLDSPQWADFDLSGANPEAPELAATYNGEPDKSLVVEGKELTLAGTITGSQTITSETAYLESRVVTDVLLRADRSHLPGGVIIGEAPPVYDHTERDVREVSGLTRSAPASPTRRRMAGLELIVFTEEAYEELRGAGPEDEWVIESIHADNGAGRIYTVSFPKVLEADPKGIPTSIREKVRRVYARFEIPYAHVYEEAPMTPAGAYKGA